MYLQEHIKQCIACYTNIELSAKAWLSLGVARCRYYHRARHVAARAAIFLRLFPFGVGCTVSSPRGF